MRRKKLLRQVAAAAVALSMAVSLSAPAFAAVVTFDLSDGGLVITANNDGITVEQDNRASSTIGKDDEIVITGTYHGDANPYGGATQTDEETQQDEDQTVTPAMASAEEETSKETSEATSEATSGAEDAPASEKKQKQNAPANGELNASAGERRESKAEDEEQPKPEAVASTSASASASSNASNVPHRASARSSGQGERSSEGERRGIIQIFNNTFDKLVKLTLDNATIDRPETAGTEARGTAAIDIQGKGNVRITVKGENRLTSNYNNAAIQKNDNTSTGKLTITAQDTNQKLTLKGYDNGAALGGRNSCSAHSGDAAGTKNIEINNGTVVVNGDFGSKDGNATGIKITGNAVVDVTGRILGGPKEEGSSSSDCTMEIEISGNAQVNVKKVNGYGGNIGYTYGGASNDKITITGNAKVNTEGCIGDGTGENNNLTVDNTTVDISGNAVVKADDAIGGGNSKVNISGNANVTVGNRIGTNEQGQTTVSGNAQLKGVSSGINDKLVLKDQAKVVIQGTVGTYDGNEAKDGAVLDAKIKSEDNKTPSRKRLVREDNEWKDMTDRLNGNCNHEKTYDLETVVPPTCSKPGKEIYKCLYCGNEGTRPVACLPHTWEKGETVAPTCTEKGYTVYECSVCHATKRDNETEPTGVHTYTKPVKTVAPTYTERGYTVYKCQNCDATEQRDWVPMLERESTNGAPNYTVTGAETYETSVVDGRYIIAVPSEDAVLNAVLGDLRAIKAQGADVVVFRTRSRESSLVIDEMLAMGTDVTPFVLVHNGGEAQLTINGAAHNELIH